MSELKPYIGPHPTDRTLTEFYLKSEADKVIADLEENHKKEVGQLLIEIEELKKQVHDYAQGLYVIQARAEKEARHSNYKRCLAMAEWCRAVKELNRYGDQDYMDFSEKWHKRWEALAEKFKPNNSNAQ